MFSRASLSDITPFGVFGGDALRMRKRLAQRGMALLLVQVDHKGDLAEAPSVENFGLFDDDLEGTLLDDAVDAVEDAFHDMSASDRLDGPACEEGLRLALMRLFRKETGRKPFIVPIVVFV